jgi:hypothetical protein
MQSQYLNYTILENCTALTENINYSVLQEAKFMFIKVAIFWLIIEILYFIFLIFSNKPEKLEFYYNQSMFIFWFVGIPIMCTYMIGVFYQAFLIDKNTQIQLWVLVGIYFSVILARQIQKIYKYRSIPKSQSKTKR